MLRVWAGRKAPSISNLAILTLAVSQQGFIGSPAANQVKHDSGSYSVVVPHMNLRYVILVINFFTLSTVANPSSIVSVNTQYWYIQKYVYPSCFCHVRHDAYAFSPLSYWLYDTDDQM